MQFLCNSSFKVPFKILLIKKITNNTFKNKYFANDQLTIYSFITYQLDIKYIIV